MEKLSATEKKELMREVKQEVLEFYEYKQRLQVRRDQQKSLGRMQKNHDQKKFEPEYIIDQIQELFCEKYKFCVDDIENFIEIYHPEYHKWLRGLFNHICEEAEKKRK